MPVDRRERLAALLARENDKSALTNREVLVSGLGAPKLRELKLSGLDPHSRAAGARPPPTAKQGGSNHSEVSMHLEQASKTMPRSVRESPLPSKRLPSSQSQARSVAASVPPSHRSESGVLEPPPPKGPHKAKGEWTLLRQFEVELSTADQAMRRKLQEKEVQQHRAFLDQQRAEKDAMMESARHQAHLEADKQKTDLTKWNLEEMAKRKARQVVEEKNKKAQDNQLAMIRLQRDEEMERIRVQEEEAVQLARRQLELEKEVERKRKSEREAKMKQDMHVMAVMIKEKEAKKQEAIDNDRRMMESYQKLLEEQENARGAAMSAMYAKAMERSAIAGAGVVLDRQSRQQKEEDMLQSQIEQAERTAQKDEMSREARRKRLNQEQMDSLKKQSQEKIAVRERAKEEKIEYARLMREKDDAEKVAVKMAAETRRHRNVHHKHELVAQMHTDRMREQPEEVMTQHELLLNAPLISRAREVLMA